MREEVVLLLLFNKHPHIARVNDVPFKLLFVFCLFCFNLLHFLFELPCYVIVFADLNFEGKFFLVFGAADRLNLWKSLADVLSQTLRVFATAMNQNNMVGVDTFDELGGLLAIGMGCKADLFD